MNTLKPAAKKPEEDTKVFDSKAPISQDRAVMLKVCKGFETGTEAQDILSMLNKETTL